MENIGTIVSGEKVKMSNNCKKYEKCWKMSKRWIIPRRVKNVGDVLKLVKCWKTPAQSSQVGRKHAGKQSKIELE